MRHVSAVVHVEQLWSSLTPPAPQARQRCSPEVVDFWLAHVGQDGILGWHPAADW